MGLGEDQDRGLWHLLAIWADQVGQATGEEQQGLVEAGMPALYRQLGARHPALGALQILADARNELDRWVESAVAEARQEGATWRQVGEALGVSAQAAHKAYGHSRSGQPWTQESVEVPDAERWLVDVVVEVDGTARITALCGDILLHRDDSGWWSMEVEEVDDVLQAGERHALDEVYQEAAAQARRRLERRKRMVARREQTLARTQD